MTITAARLHDYLLEIKTIVLELQETNKKVTRKLVREVLKEQNPLLTTSECDALITQFQKYKTTV